MAKAKTDKPRTKTTATKSKLAKPSAKKPAAKPAKKPAATSTPKPSKPATKPSSKPTIKKPAGTAKPTASSAASKNGKASAVKPASGKAEAPASKPSSAPATTAKGPKKPEIIASAAKPIIKKPKPKMPDFLPTSGKPLAGLVRKPLIQSGPKAPPRVSLSQGVTKSDEPRKSPLSKAQLQHFRTVLVRKRAELIGDVSTMETQALTGHSGSLSHTPQHSAEQGSDVYDQSLALDLAAVDRKLIKEIDDAINRIDDGTYGLCEMTGKPIKLERLEVLPWARFSIEAASEIERRSHSLRTPAPPR
jgi:DnaK suppressor protein